MKSPKQILDIYLKGCYDIHKEKIPIKYEPYIIRAMEQYAAQFAPPLIGNDTNVNADKAKKI